MSGLACAGFPDHRKAMSPRVNIAAALLLLAAAIQPVPAGAASEPPYEEKLMRLAEVLGSLHFLRNLCGEDGDQWRRQMEALLASENPEPGRRARFIARFNHGYSAFETNYTVCTESAVEAIRRYMSEGETLTRDVVTRYGN
jgi:uncharacterized protein (TIGR02301 family)